MKRLVKIRDLEPGMRFDAQAAVDAGDYTFGDNEQDDAVIVAAENLVFEVAGAPHVDGEKALVYAYPFNIMTNSDVMVEVCGMHVTIEETRTKEIWVDANDFDDAIEAVTENYRNGDYDMRDGCEVHALVGDDRNDFVEIASWYC